MPSVEGLLGEEKAEGRERDPRGILYVRDYVVRAAPSSQGSLLTRKPDSCKGTKGRYGHTCRHESVKGNVHLFTLLPSEGDRSLIAPMEKHLCMCG